MGTRTVALMHEVRESAASPAIVCEVGTSAGVIWRHAVGRLTYAPDAPPCTEATVFDLASLTKVIATTSLVMRLEREGRLALDAPVSHYLPAWASVGGRVVTIRHLLTHASGLPAHRRLYQLASTPDALRSAVLAIPLERPPGAAAVYSDLGFLVLGWVLEACAGDSLDGLWRSMWPASAPFLDYTPPHTMRDAMAPTEDDPWRGRVLQGEVHDEHAFVLGGVAPHAGLFGTAESVGVFGATVLRTFTQHTWLGDPATMQRFAARDAVPGSSRALGWDTMLPTSSCGTRLSPSAIGHTGFTGTSLWIDWERDRYIVILANRVHPTRSNERFVPMRARLHDAIIDDLG